MKNQEQQNHRGVSVSNLLDPEFHRYVDEMSKNMAHGHNFGSYAGQSKFSNTKDDEETKERE